MKFYLISYPKIPNSCCLGNFSLLNLWLKIAIFRKLRLSQLCLFLNFTVFFSKICDFVVKRVLNFRLRFNMVNYAVCSFTRFFITRSRRENANMILSKRQCCERRNFRKIAIFNHNNISIENFNVVSVLAFPLPTPGRGTVKVTKDHKKNQLPNGTL